MIISYPFLLRAELPTSLRLNGHVGVDSPLMSAAQVTRFTEEEQRHAMRIAKMEHQTSILKDDGNRRQPLNADYRNGRFR